MEENSELYSRTYIFDILQDFYTKLGKLIESVFDVEKYVVLDKSVDVPNIGITVNNKIVSLFHEFEKKGVSFFSEINSDDTVEKPCIGQIVLEHLMSLGYYSLDYINDYAAALNEIHECLLKSVDEYNHTSMFNKLFNKNRKGIPINIPYNIREVIALKKSYNECNDKVFNYKIEEDLTQTIFEYFLINGFPEDFDNILNEKIIPDLEKLGLEDQIEDLKQKLSLLRKNEKNVLYYIINSLEDGECDIEEDDKVLQL